jgi:hypothetical protein
MCRIRCTFAKTTSLLLSARGAAFVLLAAVTVSGRETSQRRGGSDLGGPYPRLPGAVTKVPDGLDTNSPFDIRKSFASLPRERNAAPLYLDALFEFGSEMSVCFPEGPERERRRQATTDRVKRQREFEDAIVKDPKSVTSTAIDDVIKLYDTGFRKIAEAQRREQCVFESSLGLGALLPHVQAARQVARIVALRVRRAIERGDFDGAMRDIETVLRLARDLRPRGGTINQLVAAAMSQYVCAEMIPRFLAATGLRAEHCDRLLTFFTAHESKSIEAYTEFLRVEYLMTRITVRDLVQHQSVIAEQFGLKPGQSVVNSLASGVLGTDRPHDSKAFPEDADSQVARTSPAKFTKTERELGQYYGSLLKLDGKPYASRIQQAIAVKLSGGDDILSRLVALMTPSPEPFVRAMARESATIRATECLIAIRRWQLGHRGTPQNMASAIKGSPLKAVPVDPYDGKPMRLTSLDGQPVVYSVGRDGKDDGARTDSDRDTRPTGDLIYRLPPVQTRR